MASHLLFVSVKANLHIIHILFIRLFHVLEVNFREIKQAVLCLRQIILLKFLCEQVINSFPYVYLNTVL